MTIPVRTCLIGVGSMALHHIRKMLLQRDLTDIRVVCEPSQLAYTLACEVFKAAGVEPPPNEQDLRKLIDRYGAELDAAFIITPHAYHHDQTIMCLEAGIDVLLEKPMVMNV